MNWQLIVGAVIAAIIIAGMGGGVAYFVWIKTRKKKETWNARIYQLGEGVIEQKLNREGKIVSGLKLVDLIPYGTDVAERVEKAPGITVYRLQTRNRPIQDVSPKFVENWGKNNQSIDVLFHDGTFSLMKKGYDKNLGDIIFTPMPLSRINMMKSEMAIRKDRLVQEKDILQAITPWIVAGMSLLSCVAMAYLLIQGMITISENLAVAVSSPEVQPQPATEGTTATPVQVNSLGYKPPTLIEGG